MNELIDSAPTFPRAEAEREGPQAHREDDAGRDPLAHVEAHANAADARRGSQSDGDGEGARNLSARSASRWVALLEPWPGSGAARRAEATSAQAARHDAGGRGGGDGVRAAARRPRAMECRAGDGGGAATRNREKSRTRDDSSSACRPRAETVAEKKCGACRHWTTSTSPRWRTC